MFGECFSLRMRFTTKRCATSILERSCLSGTEANTTSSLAFQCHMVAPSTETVPQIHRPVNIHPSLKIINITIVQCYFKAEINYVSVLAVSDEGFKCERCGRVFAYEYYREKHLKYTRCVDNGDRQFPCKLCTRFEVAKNAEMKMSPHAIELTLFPDLLRSATDCEFTCYTCTSDTARTCVESATSGSANPLVSTNTCGFVKKHNN